jgi:polar amino acid transport system substrate-binding protein
MTTDSKLLQRGLSRRALLKASGYGAVACMAGGMLGRMPSAFAAGAPIKTIRPGYLTAACMGDMPLGAVRDGQPVGTDLEMLKLIADRLELKLDILPMGFPAVIEAVRSGRADWFGGNFAWNPMRSKILLLTDPVLYDNSDACIRDVVAGRLDFAVLDAPTIDYMILQNPNMKLKQIPIGFDERYPNLTGKFQAIWGVYPQNQDLFDAINQGVRWLKSTGQIAPILARYGIKNPDYLVPMPVDPRLGVDRDEQGDVLGPFKHQARDFSQSFA